MSVPDDLPPASDLYYVALSVFDGAESYDQVGFANDNGSWQIYYSTSPVCDTRPATHWNASALSRNTTYRFEISIEAGGVVVFAALEATGGVLWQESVHTGATYLQVESTQTCGTTTLSGLTETEEVYTAVLGNPPYNFVLANASEAGLTESNWSTLPGSSNTTVVEHSGSNATIFNEPFTLRFAGGVHAVTIETASSPQVLRSTVSVAMSTAGEVVGVSAFTSAASWKFSASPSASNSSFVSVLTIDIPAGIFTGVYTVEIEASNAAGLSNRVGLVITALPGLTLVVSPHPSSGQLDANETATFGSNATGGAAGYTYSWPTLPVECAVAAPQLATCHFTLPGAYSLVAGVGDALGYMLFDNITVHALPDPVLSSPSTAIQVVVANELSLEVVAQGGLLPYVLSWTGLPPGCSSANSTYLECTPSAPGSYGVTVTLVDHTGYRTAILLSVTVENPAGSYSIFQGASVLLFVGVVLVTLIAACIVVLVRRHRRP